MRDLHFDLSTEKQALIIFGDGINRMLGIFKLDKAVSFLHFDRQNRTDLAKAVS